VNFDWAIWAANFPLSWRHNDAVPKAELPETIVISRAGSQVTLTLDEFAELARGVQEGALRTPTD
jgi:hypothetical protein